jgi:predicted acylesterase/phospholipase RssA
VEQLRDILYVCLPGRLEALKGDFRLAGITRALGTEPDEGIFVWPGNGKEEPPLRLHVVAGAPAALQRFELGYYNIIVLDMRQPNGGLCAMAADMTGALQRSSRPERSSLPNRMIAVLEPCPEMASQAFQLGRLRVRDVVTEPFADGQLRRAIERVVARDSQVGKVALCLSGGGVEGLLFELGVLRALNAYLARRSIVECDIFCGISAGSILAALLANGVEPREISRGLEGREGGVEPIGPHLLYDVDVKYLSRKLFQFSRALVGHPRPDQLMTRLIKSVPTGLFQGKRLESMLEWELTKEGRTNNFRQVKPELYIGATDLDTFEHRIFGLPGNRHVPISRAVRASSGLMPYYGPTIIDGRYYVDGQYTRTANFHLAVEQGATLVLVLDPLVPLRIQQAGYVARKGGVFASIQGLKSVIHTRFVNAIAHAAEAYPDVNFHVFTPEQEDMRVLSGSPMKYNMRTQIIDLAYRCAVQKIHDKSELLRIHMARHGFEVRSVPTPR